jgi:uncharacterized surface anchored protein
MKVLFTLLFIISGFTSFSQADQKITTTIQGTITDSATKKPVPGASVSLFMGTIEIRKVTTDEKGNYNFGQLSVGTYGLTAVAAGYGAESRSRMLLQTGKKLQMTIVMKRLK